MSSSAQDRFKKFSIFLGKADRKGLVIGHISQAFADSFGYTLAECVGHSCIPFFSRFVDTECGLKRACQESGLAPKMLEERLRLIAGHAESEVGGMAALAEKLGFPLVVTGKKTGELLVCELAMRLLRHPQLGCPYFIGICTDITGEVPVTQLLNAHSQHDYAELLALRRATKERSASILTDESFVTHSYGAAFSIWQNLKLFAQNSQKPKKSKQSSNSSQSSESRSRGSETLPSDGLSHCIATSHGEVDHCPAVMAQTEDLASAESGVEQFMDLSEDFGRGSEEIWSEGCPASAGVHSYLAPVVPTIQPDEPGGVPRQRVITTLRGALSDLDFPLAIVDASVPGFPRVACSLGFSTLTGYVAQEVLGRTCNLLLQNRNDDCAEQVAWLARNALLHAARQGTYYPGADAPGVELVGHSCSEDAMVHCFLPRGSLPTGELVCLQTSSSKLGGLIRSMVHMKQVELEDHMFVIELQERLPDPDTDPEEHDRDNAGESLAYRCQTAFTCLKQNLDRTEMTLAQYLWYSAPMRRKSPLQCNHC